jgi:hypothetical protein
MHVEGHLMAPIVSADELQRPGQAARMIPMAVGQQYALNGTEVYAESLAIALYRRPHRAGIKEDSVLFTIGMRSYDQ